VSDEVIRLAITARYRASAGVEVDSARHTFQVGHEADGALCPIALVLSGLGA